ncbi:MAG: hypothetical protein ACPL7O_08790, partial [Armatimonadota bacterium]
RHHQKKFHAARRAAGVRWACNTRKMCRFSIVIKELRQQKLVSLNATSFFFLLKDLFDFINCSRQTN